MMNFLVWPEGRKLYAVLRKGPHAWYIEKTKYVQYKEEDREKYILRVNFIGGDLYEVSNQPPKEILIVYEQQGAKPSQFDAVIEVFGDARFDYQKFCDNAKYSKKQKPTPY